MNTDSFMFYPLTLCALQIVFMIMLIMIMIRSAARQNYCSNYNGLQKRREVKKNRHHRCSK